MSAPEPAPGRRLFFALWPPESARQDIAAIARHLPLKSGKPVRADNFHITLQFLGQVSPEQEAVLVSRAAQIRVPRFDVCLDHAGYWPRPRVAWLGAAKISPALQDLVRELADIMREVGLQPDPRPYHPHMTLRRKVRPQPMDAPISPVCWTVEHFVLVHSRTLPEGVDYRPVHDFPCLGSADQNLPIG